MASGKQSEHTGPQLGAKQGDYTRDPIFGLMIRNLWIMAGGVAGLILLLTIVSIALDYSAWWLGLVTLGTATALGGPAFLAVVGTLNRTNPQRVTLYARGLTLHYPIETIALRWDEVRLIVAPSKDPAITTYLLADPTDRRHILNNLAESDALITHLKRHVTPTTPAEADA